MKTKKIVLTSLIFIILTGIFNMLCFVFENDRNENFIISLVFGNFSIVVYVITALLLFKRDRYKYLTLQNGFIVFGYYILCTVMNLLFVIFNLNNKTVNLVINILLLAAYAILIISISLSNTVSVTDLENDRNERERFNNIKEKAQELLDKGQNLAVNKKIEFLYDKICSSQINGSKYTLDIDNQIYEVLVEISYLLKSGTNAEIIEQINKASILIDDKNRKINNMLRK